jgi:hypothetical protein
MYVLERGHHSRYVLAENSQALPRYSQNAKAVSLIEALTHLHAELSFWLFIPTSPSNNIFNRGLPP